MMKRVLFYQALGQYAPVRGGSEQDYEVVLEQVTT